MCGFRMAREEPGESTIDILECRSAIGEQIHWHPQQHPCADWSAANHHEVPSSDRLVDPMAMLQTDDPCGSVLGCAPGVGWVDDSMRSGEVQDDRDFTWWEVPLVQRRGQEALTREVPRDIIAEARFGRPLRSPPVTQIRSVTGDLDTSSLLRGDMEEWNRAGSGRRSTGYRQWSATYDEPRNTLFDFDEPIVHEILDALTVGRALDAACGTGRYAAHPAARGTGSSVWTAHSTCSIEPACGCRRVSLRSAICTGFPWPPMRWISSSPVSGWPTCRHWSR
jgi:hypothetical protein